MKEIINNEIEKLFAQLEFPAQPAGLYEPLKYMVEIGGKRIRPKLCLLTYSFFHQNFSEEILSPAAGLEIFHTFTLIHDDIMDCSRLRRGHETVWKKWNETTAILSGDAMCIDSYKRIAKAPLHALPEVLELFSKTAAEVCEGQQYDMEYELRKDVSLEEYLSMIGLKTAVLIACSAKMGALIGGASTTLADALYRYGYDLGLAFQICDDFLDVYGDADVFGKPIGGDIINNKNSWLRLKALSLCERREELEKAFELPCDDAESALRKVNAVRDIYTSLGVDKMAESEIVRLSSRAMGNIVGAGLGEDNEQMLRDFAMELIGRSK